MKLKRCVILGWDELEEFADKVIPEYKVTVICDKGVVCFDFRTYGYDKRLSSYLRNWDLCDQLFYKIIDALKKEYGFHGQMRIMCEDGDQEFDEQGRYCIMLLEY